MTDFEPVWSRVLAHVGEPFFTRTGLRFVYAIEGRSVIPDRTGYPIHRSQLEKAYDLRPVRGPGEISNTVRGSAYVYAILSDSRIGGNDAAR